MENKLCIWRNRVSITFVVVISTLRNRNYCYFLCSRGRSNCNPFLSFFSKRDLSRNCWSFEWLAFQLLRLFVFFSWRFVLFQLLFMRQIDSNETVIHRQALSMRISKEGKMERRTISNFEKIRNKFPISTLIVLSSTYVEQRKIQSACWAMVTRKGISLL